MNVHSSEHSGPSVALPECSPHSPRLPSPSALPLLKLGASAPSKKCFGFLKVDQKDNQSPVFAIPFLPAPAVTSLYPAGWQGQALGHTVDIRRRFKPRLRLICDRPSLIEALLPIAPDPAPWTSSASNHVRKPQRPISGDLRPPEARKD